MKAVINGKLVFPEEIREGNLLMDGGKIIASGDVCVPEGAEIIDAGGLYVGPGLVDEHCHGYRQFGEAVDITEDVRALALAHLKHGTTTITPSAGYSLPKEKFLHILKDADEVITAGDTTVAGLHFEGPFTNPLHGSNSKDTWSFSEDLCKEIFDKAKGHVIHCTYAPEMPHGKRMEQVLKEYGVIADIGHTRSDPENIYRAVENGARIVTHLFDAMGNFRGDDHTPFSLTGDPQECVSDIVLSIPGLYYELICDSRCAHVAPVSIRQTYRIAGEDHVIVISDSTCHKDDSLNEKDYPPEDVRSAPDLNFNLDNELSGSRLTVSVSARNFMKHTGCGIRVAFKVASSNPARALGLYGRVGSIHAGKDANLVFVDESFTVKRIFFRGNEVEEVRNIEI